MKQIFLLPLLSMAVVACSHPTESPLAVPFTAKAKLIEVDSFAKSRVAGLQLFSVRSMDTSPSGRSSVWQFVYLLPDTAALQKIYWFHVHFSGIAFDSVSVTEGRFPAIRHSWFDSDSALLIAERNGGEEFRDNNIHTRVVTMVVESLTVGMGAAWLVGYFSLDDSTRLLFVFVDAVTGAFKTENYDWWLWSIHPSNRSFDHASVETETLRQLLNFRKQE